MKNEKLNNIMIFDILVSTITDEVPLSHPEFCEGRLLVWNLPLQQLLPTDCR